MTAKKKVSKLEKDDIALIFKPTGEIVLSIPEGALGVPQKILEIIVAMGLIEKQDPKIMKIINKKVKEIEKTVDEGIEV